MGSLVFLDDPIYESRVDLGEYLNDVQGEPESPTTLHNHLWYYVILFYNITLPLRLALFGI